MLKPEKDSTKVFTCVQPKAMAEIQTMYKMGVVQWSSSRTDNKNQARFARDRQIILATNEILAIDGHRHKRKTAAGIHM